MNFYNFTVIDAETTGRSNEFKDVTEFAAIKYRNGKPVDKKTSLIKARNPILPFVVELTGIDDAMLFEAPIFEDVVEDFVCFIGDDLIVGHDVDFDFKLLSDAYKEKTGDIILNNRIDTLILSKMFVKDSKNHKLETLCEYFHVPREVGHRAVADCYQTAEIYLNILNM